jgi:hypothetical protein
MRATRILLIAAATAAAAACGKDNGTEPVTGTGNGPQTIVYTLTVDTTLADTASATVATAVPVRVKLTKAGLAVPNGTVTWKSTLGSGKVSSETSTTDADGVASVLWTLGDTAGFNTLSITSFDASTQYHAVSTADAPSTLERITSDTVKVVAGASLPLSVRATDRLGNGSGGVTIEWTTSSGSITLTSTPTGSKGGATTVLTTSSPGTYTVIAALAGHGSVAFTVIAL